MRGQRRTKPARHVVGSASSAAAPSGLILTFRFCAHTCVCISSPGHTAARRTDVDFVLMKFDLSALSGMAPISRALFRYTMCDGGDTAEMHEFRRSWTASNVTYNNLPMPTPPLPFSAAVIDTYWGPSVNDLPGKVANQTVDVTPSINRWLTGTPNLGWIFVPYFSNGVGIRITSWATVAERPTLEVHFNSPPAPPRPPPAPPPPPSPSSTPPPSPQPPLPSPFVYISSVQPWAAGRAACQSLGGDLASIHSAAENAAVRAVIPQSADCADCGIRQPLALPTASSTPGKGICLETCFRADCDDGGLSSKLTMCAYGTNCVGFGPRQKLPPSPPKAPPATPTPSSLSSTACIGIHAYGSNCDDGGPCDDGGAGAELSDCRYGTDCADCGLRAQPPPLLLYKTSELRSGSTGKLVRFWYALEWLNFGNLLLRLGSLVFVFCWRQKGSDRNQCLGLAFLMLCIPLVSAMDSTRPDGDGTAAHQTASAAPPLPPPPPPPTTPLIKLCIDVLSSGAFDSSGAPMPCSYFLAHPSACSSYSIARTTCPVACGTCSPPLPGPSGLMVLQAP